jgi:amino acid adenylation domain-containing protein
MSTQPIALWKSAGAQPVRGTELPPARTVCTRRLCLPQLVHAAAALHPDAIALVGANGGLFNYGDLDRASSRLAGYLHALGVGPEVPVAICLDRSFDFVIAALAVWKAGGAYLPLDPAWPADQRQAVIDESQAPVLITRSAWTSRARYVVDIDLDAPSIGREPAFAPVAVKREYLACVLYSSGSTGRPRGVEVTHGNLLNLVFWHRRAFSVTAADRASHLAGIAIDAAVWELWPYLSAGAAIVIPPESVRTTSPLLRDWLTAQSITIGFVPAALAEPLISSRWARSTALRYLLTGADTLHRYPAAGLPFRLVNHYGPTECTVVSTSGEIAAEPDATLPPIGVAVANTQIHVLDDDRRPVKAGQIGEMYISGAGVARGYRNQAELTAERFLENPFSVSSARMYRTGDLGRVLPDGRVAFCGRSGEQARIRGHHVQPDEIVRVLDRHPGIVSSAVVARGQGSYARLVAYVVPANGSDLTAAVLRDFLARQLPAYMVPSAFVRLTELPLNSSGRLDRAALPDPSKENCFAGSSLASPVRPVERQVAAMLQDLRRKESAGTDAAFGLLDRDSKVAAQLILRVKERFAVDLSLRDLFEARTVADLAAEIERRNLSQLESMTEEETGRLFSLDASSAR